MVIGLVKSGQCIKNLQQEPRFIASLPTPEQWESVEQIPDTTGVAKVSGLKKGAGYRSIDDKFTVAVFSRTFYDGWKAAAITECPLHVLLEVEHIHEREGFFLVESAICQIFAAKYPTVDGRINERAWEPLFYKFREYHGVGPLLGNNFRYRAGRS